MHNVTAELTKGVSLRHLGLQSALVGKMRLPPT